MNRLLQSINVSSAVALAAVFVLCMVTSAAAQELERRDTVAERPRPGYDADGMPVGAMRLYPDVGIELRYNDNVFADDDIKESDTAVRVAPEIRLESRSPRHRAEIGGNGDIARYSDLGTEDYEDFRLWGLGEMQIGDGELRGELRLNKLHEDRTSPDDVRGVELTEFDRNTVYLGYTHRPGRLLLRVDGEFGNLDFKDTATLSGGVSNDDRDRDFFDIGLRGGLSMSPDYALYAEARFDEVKYDQDFDRNGFARSSDGYELRIGTLLDFTGRTAGEFYVGYLKRNFDDPRFSDADGPSFGGEITWNVTGLTTLTFGGSRTIDSTTVVGASGITKTRLEFGADHELLRNLILSFDLRIGNDDFENLPRDDDLAWVGLGGRYLMNRYLQLVFGYRYRDRDTSPSDSGGRVFEVNELFLRVVGQL
ncbi:MAG: outer membrane beta-barrel protein [Gammaproteobacteria bacterium]|nr:outer membrane beta-barrel protein [Gammaproteobacteria bacterium]